MRLLPIIEAAPLGALHGGVGGLDVILVLV